MAERRPAGFNVDLGFSDSKEVMSIPARYRAAAVGVWTLCGSWAAFKMTDGHVPPDVLKANGCTPTLRRWLITSTLWAPADDGGIWFTNWPKWQRTRAEIEEYRRAERDRKRRSRGGHADGTRTPRNGHAPDHADAADAPRNDDYAPMTGENHSLSGWTSAGLAQPVRPEPRNLSPKPFSQELSKGLSLVPQAVADATLQCFPDHCSKHRHDPDPPPCGACRQVREQNRAAAERRAAVEAVKAVDAKARERQRRADCWDCDDYGQIELYGDDGESIGVRNCHHPDVP